MTWLPLWPFLCGRTKPVLDTAIRTLAAQRPGHRLRVATENESGAARTRSERSRDQRCRSADGLSGSFDKKKKVWDISSLDTSK